MNKSSNKLLSHPIWIYILAGSWMLLESRIQNSNASFTNILDCLVWWWNWGSQNLMRSSKLAAASNWSRPNWIPDPQPKSGSARISESRGTVNGVSRWQWRNLEIYSQSDHFGLICEMIYQFLGMVAKNYKFGMLCQQCHPSVAPDGANIWQRNVSQDSHLPFVYIAILSLSPLWRHRETNPLGETSKILV